MKFDVSSAVQCPVCLLKVSSQQILNKNECDFCRLYKRKWASRDYAAAEADLSNLFGYCKAQSRDCRYDCIVPMSGGKDSTYALYLMVKRFNMRPLACTYDNGMLTDLARSNIRNAIDTFGVDHVMVAPDKTELKAMYRHFFATTKNICTVCNQGINAAICKTAAQEGIPLIILGGVGKLECAPIYGNKRYCMEDVFVSVMGKGVPAGVYHNYRTKQICSNHRIVPVTIYNYVNYDYATVLATVKAELGWHDAPLGQEKIDCLFHHAISALKFRQNGVTSTMLMASALLRDKQVSIDQYWERIENEERRRDENGKNEIQKLLDYLELDDTILNKQVHITDFVEPVLTDAAEETLRKELACSTLSLKKRFIVVSISFSRKYKETVEASLWRKSADQP
jgi:hypothetical protein